jgi:uncharacterized protein (DUF1015 family)
LSTLPLIQPFCGLRPAPGRAADLAAPPYDVLSADEARERAAGRQCSSLRISKAEIDLPAATDPYSPAAYARSAENFRSVGVRPPHYSPACGLRRPLMSNVSCIWLGPPK